MHRMLTTSRACRPFSRRARSICYPNFTSLIGRPLGPNGTVSNSTLELADVILGEAKVALVPGEAFGTPGYARFSFAMADADMEEGIRRIHQFVAAEPVTTTPVDDPFGFETAPTSSGSREAGSKWHKHPGQLCAGWPTWTSAAGPSSRRCDGGPTAPTSATPTGGTPTRVRPSANCSSIARHAATAGDSTSPRCASSAT